MIDTSSASRRDPIANGISDLESGKFEVRSTHPAFVCQALSRIWDPNYYSRLASRLAPALPQPEWFMGMTKEFTKNVQGIDTKLQGRVLKAITAIVHDPTKARGDTIKPLAGEMKGLWRYRIGDYRLVYKPENTQRHIILVAFDSRGDIYET
jgi:addiction module RelE/StbE family toxin